MEIYRKYELLGLAAMNDFRIVPQTSALVVVDMQYGSTHPDYGFQRLYQSLGMERETRSFRERLQETVVPNIGRLLTAFRDAWLSVIYLTIASEVHNYRDFCARRRRRIAFWQEHGLEPAYAKLNTRDAQILDEIAPRADEEVINKTTASAFNSSRFEQVLKARNLDTLVFAGVGTNYCVEMTFRDASDRGYQCLLAEDACATSTSDMHARAVDTMTFYGRVLSTREILDEVAAMVAASDAGMQTFKGGVS